MPDIWFLALVASAGILTGAFAVRRHRKFRYTERLHHQLAAELGLQAVFTQKDDFRIFGYIRGYHVSIYPQILRAASNASLQQAVQVSIPMTNPLRKGWRAVKRSPHFPTFDDLGKPNRAVHLTQEVAGIEIASNDPVFSGVLLTDDLKISLHELFKDVPAGAVFIEDETLAAFFPGLILDQLAASRIQQAVRLLIEIKDDLKTLSLGI